MIVKNFLESCSQYENFQIWDVDNMQSFLSGNGVLEEIFQQDYKIQVSDFSSRRAEIPQSDMEIMNNLLDQVGDKHFFIFTHFDDNHKELIHMQDAKIMQFGIDISKIDKEHVYIVIMDKVSRAN